MTTYRPKSIDQLVCDFILDKYMTEKHNPQTQGAIEVLSVDAEWECGCYSEYTRDDQFVMTATLRDVDRDHIFEYRYGTWGDLPALIESIKDYEDLKSVCHVERND